MAEKQSAVEKLRALKAKFEEEQKVAAAKHEESSRAILQAAQQELSEKMKLKRDELKELEREYEELTGKPVRHTFGQEVGNGKSTGKRTRSTASIDDIRTVIRTGKGKNYKEIARELGCSPAYVTSKIKKEGKAAGIQSRGERVNFELFV